MTAAVATPLPMNNFLAARQAVGLSGADASLACFYHQQQQQTSLELQPVQPRKRVMFSSVVHVSAASSPLDKLTDTEVPQMWYQMQDLALFRQQARDACRLMRPASPTQQQQQQQQQQQPQQPAQIAMAAADGETRGLESRTCLERQRRKYLAVKCIVRAQSKLQDADRLAALAQRCTRWAAEVAREEASRDFVRAHGFPAPISSSVATVTFVAAAQEQQQQQQQQQQIEFSDNNNKRTGNQLSNDRRVRRRV